MNHTIAKKEPAFSQLFGRAAFPLLIALAILCVNGNDAQCAAPATLPRKDNEPATVPVIVDYEAKTIPIQVGIPKGWDIEDGTSKDIQFFFAGTLGDDDSAPWLSVSMYCHKPYDDDVKSLSDYLKTATPPRKGEPDLPGIESECYLVSQADITIDGEKGVVQKTEDKPDMAAKRGEPLTSGMDVIFFRDGLIYRFNIATGAGKLDACEPTIRAILDHVKFRASATSASSTRPQ